MPDADRGMKTAGKAVCHLMYQPGLDGGHLDKRPCRYQQKHQNQQCITEYFPDFSQGLTITRCKNT